MAKKHISLITKAKARALIQSGLSSRQVASRLQIGKTTVNSWVAVEGEERHPPPRVKVCAHRRILVPGHVCADCGTAGPASPPPPVRPEIPEWLQGPDEIQTPQLRVAQPFWGLETQ